MTDDMTVQRDRIDVIRAAISTAYYAARDDGRTMEQAADDATAAVLSIVRSVEQQALAAIAEQAAIRHTQAVATFGDRDTAPWRCGCGQPWPCDAALAEAERRGP